MSPEKQDRHSLAHALWRVCKINDVLLCEVEGIRIRRVSEFDKIYDHVYSGLIDAQGSPQLLPWYKFIYCLSTTT